MPAAECPIKENNIGRYLIAYYKDIDLNNDGRLENVKIIEPQRVYTNLNNWQDDTGAVVIISDKGNNG